MPRKSRKNVGLIGLGIIGSRVAAGLRASGFHVFVWNRTAKPAPNFVGSPAELAELCDIIQLFVADAQALFDVVEQMRDVLTPQHVVVCNATVGPEATIEAARLVEETGAHFLDAPFTGSKAAAEKRALVYYIGGDEATFLRARPVLEATSKAIVRIGGVGHAATIKVVTNMIAAVSIQTLGEALAIVQKAGLDPEVLAAALEQNACRSATMDMKLPKMIAGDYEAHFSLKHMFKDVQLGIHVANALDIEIPATTVTAGVMYGALNQGWGDLDFSALYKIYQTQPAQEGHVGELAGGVAQIEDLDARDVHYPETTVPAPPRPGSEAAAGELIAGHPGIFAEPEPKTDASTSGLDAPVERRSIEPAIPPAPAPSAAVAAGSIMLAPLTHEAIGENIILAGPGQYPGSVVWDLKSEPAAAAATAAAAAEIKPETPVTPEPLAKLEPLVEPNPAEPTAPVPFPAPKAKQDNFPARNLLVVEPDAPALAQATNGDTAVASLANNGFPDEPANAQKPFNFVKRWFVARTGS